MAMSERANAAGRFEMCSHFGRAERAQMIIIAANGIGILTKAGGV